jgi:hypothetical protein
MFDEHGNILYWCQTEREHEVIQNYVKTVEKFIAQSSRPDVSATEFHSGGVYIPGEGA